MNSNHLKFRWIQGVILMWMGIACKSEVRQVPKEAPESAESTSQGQLELTSRIPLLVRPGTTVKLSGSHIRSTLTLAFGGEPRRPMAVTIASDSSASFVAPDDLPHGALELIAEQEGVEQKVSLFFYGGLIDYPIITADPKLISSGVKFYDAKGILQQGTMAAGGADALPLCTVNGATGCVANDDFPANKLTNLSAENIKNGVTIGNVKGTHGPECTGDGGALCLVDGTIYKAAKLSLFGAGDLKSGVSIAGVSGTLGNCAVDGAVGCVVVGPAFKVADTAVAIASNIKFGVTIAGVVGSLVSAPVSASLPCASDGAIGCLAVSLYPAAAATGLASKVLGGQTVGGIVGNVTLPAAGNVFTGISYGASGSSVTGSLTLPAAGTVLLGSGAYGVAGTGTTPTLTLPSAANVKTGSGDYGNPGSQLVPSYSPDFPDVANVRSGDTVNGVTGSLGNCTDGGAGCVVIGPAFAAAVLAGAADKLLLGQSLAGIAGNVTLPTVSNVFLGQQYGVSGTGLTGTLTLPAAASVRTAVGNYGIGGTSLTASLGDCSINGTIGCVTTASYQAANLTNVTAGNIKSGVLVAGVSGTYPSASTPLASNTVATDLITFGPTTAVGSYEFFDSEGRVYSATVADGGTVTPTTSNQTSSTAGTMIRAFTVAGSGSLVASNIKTAVSLFGITGTYGGTGAYADCNTDAQTGCSTVTNFPAIDRLGASQPAKILSGQSVGGIAGTYTPDFPTVGNVLSSDTVNNAAGTLTVPAAGAVLLGSGTYGVGGNGITPTLTLPAAGKVLSGSGTYGIAGTGTTPTLTLPTATNVKTGSGTYGDPGAAVTPSYSPDFPIVGNVLSTDTVNGAPGTLTLPVAGKVLSGSGTYGVAGTGTTPTLTLPGAANVLTGSSAYGDPGAAVTPSYSPDFPAVGNVLSTDTVNSAAGTLTLPPAADVFLGVGYGVAGSGSTGTLTLATAANVRTGNGAFGRGGTSVTPSLADCSTNAVTGCVTTATYQSANLTNLAAGNVKRGVALAGVTGNFPSAASLLPRYSDNGGSTAVAGVDETDLTVFTTQLTSAGTFEYWDSAGIRRTGSGDVDITAANIKKAVAFENLSLTGTYAPNVWDVRAGVDLGGGTLGKLKVNCRNGISSSFYNYDGAVGSIPNTAVTSGTVYDVWDTLDDWQGLSTGFPAAWSVLNNFCGGVAANATDDNVWLDVTRQSPPCNATQCTYKDKISGLEWSKFVATSYTWSQAVGLCDGMTLDGQSDWRLPTNKEVAAAYAHGISSAATANWIAITQMRAEQFWTSTSYNVSDFAYSIGVTNGYMIADYKTATKSVVCVR